MGATNTTTHYNLSQFVSTDKPAWLQDYNGDMLKIDNGIDAAKVAADTAQTTANAANGAATQAASDISSLGTAVSGIGTNVTALQSNVNTINSLIGNGTPTTTDQTIIGAINEINGKVSGGLKYVGVVADGVKSISTLLDELYNAFNAVSGAVKEDCILRVQDYYAQIMFISNTNLGFIKFDLSSSGIRAHEYDLLASGSKFKQVSGGSYTDSSNLVLPSASVLRIYYHTV